MIVVDSGSTDGSAEAVRHAFPDVDVVAAGRNLGAAARTLGVARASTPYVAFRNDSWWSIGASTGRPPTSAARHAGVGPTVVEDPRISVVVITRSRRGEVLEARRSALPERPPVMVVDNGSTDGPAAAVADAYPQAVLLVLASNHGAAGRDLGVDVVDTPYLAFCDDDTWWERGRCKPRWSSSAPTLTWQW